MFCQETACFDRLCEHMYVDTGTKNQTSTQGRQNAKLWPISLLLTGVGIILALARVETDTVAKKPSDGEGEAFFGVTERTLHCRYSRGLFYSMACIQVAFA